MPKNQGSNLRGADARAHGIDLDAPGGLDALFALRRSQFGNAVMELQNDGGDGQDGDDKEEADAFSGLLDDEAEGENTDDDGDDDGDDDEGGNGGSSALTAEAIADIVERAIDRRLSTPKQRRGRDNGDRSERGGSNGSRSADRIDAYDVREARSTYREYIADEVKFLGPAERDHALALANEHISTALTRGEDPVRAGREAARATAKSIKSLRSLYENRTVKALRSKGLIVEQDSSQGQPSHTARTGSGSAGSKWASGQSAAAALGRSKSAQQK